MMMIIYDDVGDYDGFHDDDGGEWRRWGTLGNKEKVPGEPAARPTLTHIFSKL